MAKGCACGREQAVVSLLLVRQVCTVPGVPASVCLGVPFSLRCIPALTLCFSYSQTAWPPAGIKASTRDGVLTVTVPKTEEPKPKSIDVSVE